ncbi:MAG TPA: nitrate transporter permease, partial [Solibacterales bacterium]|nr:nitrate transporter permease [Bryobacterales bacterium]
MGVLTDRYGGRAVFPIVFVTVGLAAGVLAKVGSFEWAMGWALLLGL